MQAKKKSIPVKKNPIRKKQHKISSDQADTINTTKQRTFATIEQTFEFQDHKTSTRTTHNTSRRDCLDRMEANKLSPFSSPGHSSSPRQRKVFSPIVVKQQQHKRTKKNSLADIVSNQKKINLAGNKNSKNNKTVKQKNKISQKVMAQFQNQFLKRMNKLQRFNEKKITELSQEEMEASIRKLSKPILPTRKQSTSRPKKNKTDIIREMHMKIKEKYKKQYPNLKTHELKLLSAVVLIQRLWRQTKVKLMIGQFLSPRNISINHPYQQTFGKLATKQFDNSKLPIRSLEVNQSQNTMKTEKSLISLSPKSADSKQDSSKNLSSNLDSDQNSSLLVTPSKCDMNLKDLQVSDEFSSSSSVTKAKQILKYIDLYRQVTLKSKKDKKKKKISKPNAFNFPESLSQKCLLQNLYKKRMTNIQSLKEKGQQKSDLLTMFLPSKSIQKSKQQYISPKKPQIVQLEERFYTQAQDEQYPQVNKLEKQPIKPQQQTVGSISNVASKIIEFLINQFSEQFQAFSTKKCLKKKKRLPGIPINDSTITTYLNCFTEFVSSQYKCHIEESFRKINANSFLKIFRVLPEQDIFELDEEDEEEDLNYPVLPSSAFFQYEPIYEEKVFTIKEQDKKYSNFLSGLIKIHNKCLVDCFSEYIQKQRIQSIQFPWQKIGRSKSESQTKMEIENKMSGKVQQINKRIIAISNTKLGKLHKRDADTQQMNLLKSLKEDYKREGKDWSEQQDLLEMKLQLTQLICQQIMNQMVEEFPW